MSKDLTTQLTAARRDLHSQLVAFPNAIGSAVGFKRSERTDTTSRKYVLVVYVREKLPLEALDDGSRVPTSVTINGKRFSTDVCTLGSLEYQFGTAPWFCRDRPDNQGTVTTLCRTTSGETVALTCCHCIGGTDDDPATKSLIFLWDETVRNYLRVGVSSIYGQASGYSLPNNFVGFSDWGLFSVEDKNLRLQAEKATPLLMGQTNLGTRVVARTAHGVVKGVIDQIKVQLPNICADVSIRLSEGAMFKGDSGSLWRDANGRGVAIHAIGSTGPTGSPVSLGMFAPRIAETLKTVGIQMLAL